MRLVSSWAALVPIKATNQAKSRLIHHTAEGRRDLAQAFAADVICALASCEDVMRIIIIGGLDTTLIDVGIDVEIFPDDGRGLNSAIQTTAQSMPDLPTFVIVGDLPAVTTDQINTALASAQAHERSIISDGAGTGTTTLLAQSPTSLNPQFGIRSRAAHVSSGAVDLMDILAPGLRRDVDTQVDLWDARRLGVGAHTRAALDRWQKP